ncbi:MAG: hypothetical protein KKD07_06940 [Candidatus Omnitrophica bacterium]|nr:hypothetical protein [Candidatus Omnitrophota bacterium]MBU4334160.1 hypothetical protein [Candidatus Omnitrophota bacterium]
MSEEARYSLSQMITPVSIQTSGFGKLFKTKYADIYYSSDKDIDTFIWRLGGQRMEFLNNLDLASNRVDRIVNRVQTILDMWPEDFKIIIYLHPETLGPNKVAYYEYQTASLHFSIDYASDGVVAHEMAHAIINQYFPSRSPSKMQEILSQYVDEHLWSDY